MSQAIIRFSLVFWLVAGIFLGRSHAVFGQVPNQEQDGAAVATVNVDLVFVARAHLATRDDIFVDELGPAGQFGSGLPKFAPGSKLMIRQSDGTLRTLVDGSNPSAATAFLVDVQSPDVSFDGSRIVFAGATTVDPESSLYGWRLYEINVDGSGFRRLNIPDRSFLDVPNNNPLGYNFGNRETYGWWNDLFPAYLADGRIVFASSRYPIRTHYDGRHTYNLYVVNGDGSGLHRITTDRGGFLHPTPLPDGRIMATRWWNNFNQPSDTGIYNRVDNQPYSYLLPDGTLLDANPNAPFVPATGRLPSGIEIRGAPNSWHLMVLNPDGTDLQRYAHTPYSKYALTEDSGLDTYTAAQPALVFAGGQTLVAFTSQQDTTMVHSTLLSGIRVAHPGVENMYANTADAIAGLSYDRAWEQNDESPPYALHPWGLPDGSILFSYTLTPTEGLPEEGSYTDRVTGETFALQGSNLQYRLYTMAVDGSGKEVLPIEIGTADAMDAKPIVARSGWVALPDAYTAVPSDDPRAGNVPNTLAQYAFSNKGVGEILTATVHNPNVYANPPLDIPFINNSPMPGTIARAQIYLDANQFTGVYCYGDYPDPCDTFQSDDQVRGVLWTEVPVSLKGEFTATVPADTPGFVVLRDVNGRAVGGWNRGHVSIAQGNAWARPGETVTCVGCHLGHVSGSIEPVLQNARQGWTNIAPYATVTVTSYMDSGDPDYQPFTPDHLNDRRGWIPATAATPGESFQDDTTGWLSAEDHALGEQVGLQWPLPMMASAVRLVGPPTVGGDWGGFGQYSTISPYAVTQATLRLYDGATEVAALPTGQIKSFATGGTSIYLPTPTRITGLTLTIEGITGKWHWTDRAALNEIEVLGMAAAPLCQLTGDLNRDGAVNIHDIVLITGAWPYAVPQADPRDTNESGRIDIPDVMNVTRYWNSSCIS